MTSALPSTPGTEARTDKIEGGLDVDWLLHAKKDPLSQAKAQKPKPIPQNSTPAPASIPPQTPQPPPRAIQKPDSQIGPTDQLQAPPTPRPTNGPVQTPSPAEKSPFTAAVTPPPRQPSQDDTKNKAGSGNKKDSKRPSWFSNLGHKLSTGGNASRNSSVDSTNSRKSPQPSPRVERGNPFNDKNSGTPDAKSDTKPIVYTPRRPSVLVAAGTETKLDNQPGFLTSALRRFSSGGAAQLAKSPSANGAIYPRKIMNIDRNRERSRLSEFDQAKLRRVAFKVDVEIAGIAAQGDEQYDPQNPAGLGIATPNLNIADEPKDLKLAKQKDKSEGAALKRTASKEASGTNVPQQAAPPEPISDAAEEQVKQEVESEIKADESNSIPDGTPPPTSRKKEKKKRTEAERKERKERKRRHAEANGLVPLELTIQDDDSDSSPSNTPTGATTPRKGQPTTDPLRIYKRCCQLRETTALTILKDQISKPSATLAEAPGIVASLDVSGNDFTLQDIQTLGDWLAVVPVRRLILDNCSLSDEGLRIILSGLSSCKSQEQARHNRKLPKRNDGKPGQEQLGVIEKLSLKHNSDITSIGWKYIAQFLHMNRSLRGIDLSGIPFPATTDLSRTSTNTGSSTETVPPKTDPGALLAKALSQRFGNRLEEMILNGCALPAAAIPEIIDSAIACNIKRIGFANNKLDSDTVPHFERYIMSGMCEGMDLGGNNLRGSGHRVTKVMDENNPFFALSLADCNLSVDDLKSILQNLAVSHNFKFLDVSHNHDLCNGPNDAIPVLRRYLPKLLPLKRVHLADLNMNTSQLIALAEILPDCRELAHVSVLENSKLVECMNSPQGKDQEEACAVFVSLMTAVRTSKTLVAVEIEVPGHESSEIVKALASQVVAYGLRNFERTAFGDDGDQADPMPDKLDKQAPEVLLHLVGHMDGYSENHDNDDPAPDDDYVLASSGIIKALDVCLGSREAALRSGNISPSASGTATPRSGRLVTSQARKPKNVSIELCQSARKIRLRLRPAMVKEDQAGNINQYRRLMMLDQTLQGIIQRFEDEYPDAVPEVPLDGRGSRASSFIDPTPRPQDSSHDPLDRVLSQNSQEEDPFSLNLSRTSSHTSLAARNLTQEEGRMHRFGQSIRREVLRPTGTDDFLHGTSINDEPEPAHIATLRDRLEQMKGEEIRSSIEKDGADNVLKELGFGVQDLLRLMEEDPEGFEVFKHSQMAAQINAGLITRSEEDVKRAKEHSERSVYGGHSNLSAHQAVTQQ